MYDTIIIGGGYGGLTCAVALAKAGQRVCVLEKGRVLGGAFQTFRRKGVTLDTGFHHIGGVASGEMMHPMMETFGLADLPWVRLDEQFLTVHADGEEYHLRCGYEKFAQTLGDRFPDDRKGIDELVATMREIAQNMYRTVELGSGYENRLMLVAAKGWIEERISNPRLRKLLCAQALTTELTPDLPLYSFTQSLNSFVQHTYRVAGGGETVIERLRQNIERLGGEIRTRCEVVAMSDNEEGQITEIRCADGSSYAAHNYIATMHPAVSVGIMPESKRMRSIYRRRITQMANSRGIFTVQLALNPDKVRYRNHIISILGSPDPWNADYSQGSDVKDLLIHFNVPQNESETNEITHTTGNFATNIDLLTPMDNSAVEQWADSHVGHRPDDYKAFKEQKARECIELAAKHIPELKENIAAVYTSTPLTYRDYTGTKDGSAYGIRKSASLFAGGMLSPTTPFKNLYLAGQSLMLHGMLGVGMTSLLVTNIIKNAGN